MEETPAEEKKRIASPFFLFPLLHLFFFLWVAADWRRGFKAQQRHAHTHTHNKRKQRCRLGSVYIRVFLCVSFVCWSNASQSVATFSFFDCRLPPHHSCARIQRQGEKGVNECVYLDKSKVMRCSGDRA
jgi:hypothetical protein